MADVLSGLGLINDIVHQMKQEIMNASWMIAVGLLMIFSGLLHKNESFARWDARIFQIFHIPGCFSQEMHIISIQIKSGPSQFFQIHSIVHKHFAAIAHGMVS